MLASSGWEYKNSSGVTISAGSDWEVLGSKLKLYLNSPYGLSYLINAYGIGLGVGASLADVTASMGATMLPSDGSFLYTPNGQALNVTPDLSSVITIYSASAGAGGGVSASFACFLGLSNAEKIMWALKCASKSPLDMLADYFQYRNRGAAVCWFAGDQATLNLAVDLNCTWYAVSSVEPGAVP